LGGKGEGKAMNMSKTLEVLQETDESLSQFYECLYEAFHLYTSFDPEATENQMIKATFVGQVQRDTRQKLQKLEGFAGMNTSQLLEWPQSFYSIEIRKLGGRLTKDEKESGCPCSSPFWTVRWALAS
jgi:hypothetical protein